MKEKLKDLKERKFIGAVELADEAARLVARYVPRQERGSVSEVPDERMIRYYSQEGLISAPEGRQGAAAVYGYQHLLQLLVIKRLQADHLPIKKIREICEHKSVTALEGILGLRAEGEKRARNAATEYLESLLKPQARKSPPAELQSVRPAPFVAQQPSAWSRAEIEPGLEVHVRDDYRLPDDARDRQRLARKIMNAIESYGNKPIK
jgi:DNA-binding transcriptional MerR regulator